MLKHNQLFFHFTKRIKDHLLVLNFNKLAYKYLFYNNWPFNVIILLGEAKTGKTCLLKAFANKQNGVFLNNLAKYTLIELQQLVQKYTAVIVEDININLAENNLFILYNLILEHNKKLILSSNVGVNNLNIGLVDLKTRLQQAAIVTINYPNNEEAKLIFNKMLSDHQLKLNEQQKIYILEYCNYNLGNISIILNKIISYLNQYKKLPSLKIITNMLQNENS